MNKKTSYEELELMVKQLERENDEHKQSEELLKIREAQLAESQKVAKLGSWYLNLISQELEWSIETYKLFDKEPENFLPSFDEFAQLVHPDDLETMQTHFNNALENDDTPYHVQIRIINYSSREWIMEAFGKVNRDKSGNPLSIFGTAQDVTLRVRAEEALRSAHDQLEERIKERTAELEEINNSLSAEIAEHKLTEKKLKQSEGNLNKMFAFADYMVCIADLKTGYFTKISPAFTRHLGWSEKEMFSKPILDFIHPSDVKKTEDIIKEQMEKGVDVLQFENRYKTKRGDYRWFEWSAKPVIAEGITYSAAYDITERKQAEEELKIFQRFAEESAHGIGWSDMDGNIIYINPTLCEMFGEECREDVYGKPVTRYYDKKTQQRLTNEIFPTVLKNGKWIGELDFHSSNGKVISTMNNLFSLLDKKGAPLYFANLLTDITKRKKTEEALRESKERYQTLFEMESDAIAMIDVETGNMLDVNQAFISLYGYSREECLQMKNTDFSQEPDKTKNSTHAHQTLVPTRWHKKSNGTVFPTEIVANTFKYQGRDVQIAAIRDITERKQLESKVQQATKMQAVGTLAGGIAHEFNNLLGVIMGCTDMARDEMSEDSFAKVQLDKVMTASYRVKDLVKQILTFSHQSQQKRISTNLYLHIKESLNLIQSSIPSSVTINKIIEASCDNTLVDPTEIQQIIMNLYSNAVWAVKEQGTIEITLRKVRLTAKESSSLGLLEDNYIKFSFADSGQGMDEETKSRIFDPFYTRKGVGEGTGMGLSIVYAIMESYKGTITVESEVGIGSTFHLYFPVTDEPAEEKLEQIEDVPKGTERILFVDDEENYAEMGAEMIARLGYDVELKVDSSDALNVFKTNPEKYHLVITDQVMPNLSGEELVKEIRTIKPNIPIILCTGYSSQMNDEKAKKLGINKFAYKPIVKKDIAKIIRDVLDAS